MRISDWSSDVCSSDLAATRMSVSDTLRWPADDRVDEFKTPELYAIGRTLGGGQAVQRLADQYVKVIKDRRRQLVGDALKADWTKWVTGCSAKWARACSVSNVHRSY